MLLQRLATGATGVKQARYRRGGSETLYAHAQYNMHDAYEFRRGFCTSVLSFGVVPLSLLVIEEVGILQCPRYQEGSWYPSFEVVFLFGGVVSVVSVLGVVSVVSVLGVVSVVSVL